MKLSVFSDFGVKMTAKFIPFDWVDQKGQIDPPSTESPTFTIDSPSNSDHKYIRMSMYLHVSEVFTSDWLDLHTLTKFYFTRYSVYILIMYILIIYTSEAVYS